MSLNLIFRLANVSKILRKDRGVLKTLFPPFCGVSTRFGDIAFPDEARRSHSLDTPHSVGPSWTSDQLDAETLPDNTQHL